MCADRVLLRNLPNRCMIGLCDASLLSSRCVAFAAENGKTAKKIVYNTRNAENYVIVISVRQWKALEMKN